MGDRAKKRGTNIGEDDGMYSLVIAEDEKMMRESLVKLVDWASLGFAMEAAFSDGAQLIDYLRTHIPDVVLTDIQMIRVDGMEVARFIHEHNLPTCVILLTGHKNFEYARSAIEYRVKRYLLKPITVPQLKAVFRETCAALDDQEYIERVMQSILYLPHFISWVVVISMLTGLLSQSTGVVNTASRRRWVCSSRWSA